MYCSLPSNKLYQQKHVHNQKKLCQTGIGVFRRAVCCATRGPQRLLVVQRGCAGLVQTWLRAQPQRTTWQTERLCERRLGGLNSLNGASHRQSPQRQSLHRIRTDRTHADRAHTDRIHTDRVYTDRIHTELLIKKPPPRRPRCTQPCTTRARPRAQPTAQPVAQPACTTYSAQPALVVWPNNDFSL